jgi:molybdopterin-guanine dinucleotide biosynthesis protein A
MPDEGFAAIVLAGGAGRRLGGATKPLRPVGGRAMLLRVLDACAAATDHRIVVGPSSLAPLLPPGVELTQEQPSGGGPVAGLAAALRLVRPGARRVALLSADLPFFTATVLSGLSGGLDRGDDVAVLVDGDGRRQWLCAVWRLPALRRLLAPFGDAAGVAMRDVVAHAGVKEVEWGGGSGPPPWFDCDTDEDIRRAEEWVHADPR